MREEEEEEASLLLTGSVALRFGHRRRGKDSPLAAAATIVSPLLQDCVFTSARPLQGGLCFGRAFITLGF